jgi:hypothetical protein
VIERDDLDDDAETLCSYPACRKVTRNIFCDRHRAEFAVLVRDDENDLDVEGHDGD